LDALQILPDLTPGGAEVAGGGQRAAEKIIFAKCVIFRVYVVALREHNGSMIGSIDTLSAAKALKGAGFDDAGAEAIVAVVHQATGQDHLVTKADLSNELEKLEGRLKLFVASTVLGGAAVIVLAQIVSKALGIAA
jgi:hypothetical protein